MKLNRADLGLGGGSLLQVANRSLTQMMSYIIDTPDGNVIVIDGGHCCEVDATYLYELLAERGKKVDLWLMTHAHVDHLGALLWLFENCLNFDIVIEKMVYKFPPVEWLAERKDDGCTARFLEAIKTWNIPTYTPQAGELLTCGGMSLEIVSVPEEYENYPTINATSIITVAHFPKRDVLFLADFDIHGQDEFLRKHDPESIRKDIVQMAHHGQGGVDFSFYKLIHPKICLYPTPQWLWENNKYRCTVPASAGTGPFTTLETRQWMEELGVEQSLTHAEGDYVIT
ncbi:MAG: MBL fold metallo-hydrolase [Lachnospiraceae bacterium]|nr:MBL fold metallo-hydrolase [Lachnospiraceae bacterium]